MCVVTVWWEQVDDFDEDDRRGGRRVVRKWTVEEDDEMTALVMKYGTRKWSVVGNHLPGRNGKQCRER